MDGDRLKQLRKEKKLTQSELGNIINVSKVSISGYESGDRSPDTDNLRRLADFFDVSTDYLMGRTKKDKYETQENYDSLAEITRLIKEYGIDHSGFFDIEKWKAMGPEEIRQLESHFQFMYEQAKKRNSDKNSNNE